MPACLLMTPCAPRVVPIDAARQLCWVSAEISAAVREITLEAQGFQLQPGYRRSVSSPSSVLDLCP